MKKEEAIEMVKKLSLEEEYEKIKKNFYNIAFFASKKELYEIWINTKKAIEVTRSYDGKILKIKYLGEKNEM
jgi:hypothetical protein